MSETLQSRRTATPRLWVSCQPMRAVALVAALLAVSMARAERILLIPLDSRPASGQFAQMIGAIADVDVQTPPPDTLGRFTTAGSPGGILKWLGEQDMSDVSAVVASADMMAYGGLIQSRAGEVSKEQALSRIDKLIAAVRKTPKVRLYLFSSVMRLVPTATKQARGWRMQLATYYETRDKWQRTGDRRAYRTMLAAGRSVPTAERQRYERTRARDFEVQKALVARAAQHRIDFLILGQDDAKQFGPQVAENLSLQKFANAQEAGGMVFFGEGIDQHAAVLVSRALLKQHDYAPKVRVLYSDDAGRTRYASFESKPVESTLIDQVLASGARIAKDDEASDYTLYVNTPQPRREPFDAWLRGLLADLDAAKPVALADINLGSDGSGDPLLWAWIRDRGRMVKMLSYAAWNTAGNTIGTALPAANVYVLAKKLDVDPLKREMAQKEFLLHRLVNDYAYHKFTRPIAYDMIDSDPKATREETGGVTMYEVNDFVRRDLSKQLERTYEQQFKGQTFLVGDKPYRFTGLSDVSVSLPWPRAYEVRMSFHLNAEPVVAAATNGESGAKNP